MITDEERRMLEEVREKQLADRRAIYGTDEMGILIDGSGHPVTQKQVDEDTKPVETVARPEKIKGKFATTTSERLAALREQAKRT